jgi:hypothetical protein
MTASGLGQSPPRSHILFLLAAVAVSSLAACSDEGGRGSDTMTEPTSATAAASTAGTQVEPGPTTLTAPATTEPVAEEIDDASNQAGSASAPTIEEISAARARALAALPGYTATQTLTGPFSRQVTALADGRKWAEDSTGSWYSVDPTTGTYKSFHAANDFGAASAEVITAPGGAAPPSDLGRFPIIGGDPTAPISIPREDDTYTLTIDETIQNGSPAWRVIVREVSSARFVAGYAIDIATGLIVETRGADGQGGYTLTDLTVTDTLPDAYPGVIPDGIPTEELTWPSGLRQVTKDEAALQFDPPGLFIPANPHGSIDYYLYDPTLDAPNTADPNRLQLTMVIQDGFDRSYIVITRSDPANPELTTPTSHVACVLPTHCSNFATPPVDEVRTGALAGRKIRYAARGHALIIDNERHIEIVSTDLLRVQQIANDLTPA